MIASDQAVGLLMVWVTVSRTRETSSSQACGAKLGYVSQAPTDIFKTGTLYGPDKLAVPGKVEGRNCQITIDTGSNISIVRPDVLPEKKQSEIHQPMHPYRYWGESSHPGKKQSSSQNWIRRNSTPYQNWIHRNSTPYMDC